MTDYRIKVTVRNARILRAIKDGGHDSVMSFARSAGVNYGRLIDLIAMRVTPVNEKSGRLKLIAQEICDALCMLPEDLWTDDQLFVKLQRSTYEVDVSEDRLVEAISSIDAKKALGILSESIRPLTPRETKVLHMRFGIGMNVECTLDEVAMQFGVDKERIRQIEAKALHKLRHPVRTDKLLLGATTLSSVL